MRLVVFDSHINNTFCGTSDKTANNHYAHTHTMHTMPISHSYNTLLCPIKKSALPVIRYMVPLHNNVGSMHCAYNELRKRYSKSIPSIEMVIQNMLKISMHWNNYMQMIMSGKKINKLWIIYTVIFLRAYSLNVYMYTCVRVCHPYEYDAFKRKS